MPKIYIEIPNKKGFEKVKNIITRVCKKIGLEIAQKENIDYSPYPRWQILIEISSFLLIDVTLLNDINYLYDLSLKIGYAQRAQKSIFLISQKNIEFPELNKANILIYNLNELDKFENRLIKNIITICEKERIRYFKPPEINISEIDKKNLPIISKKDMRWLNYNSLGDYYIDKGLYEQAIEEYTQAILILGKGQLKPFHSNIFLKRGYSYIKIGAIKEGENDLSKAIELYPNYSDAYLTRGKTYFYLGNYKKALSDFKRVKEINPDYIIIYLLLGKCYRSLKDYKNSLEEFNKLIKLNPKYYEAFFERGKLYIELKDYPKAIEDFSQSLKLNKNFIKAYLERGYIYKKLGNYDLAIKDFNKAIQLDPNNIEAYKYRGEALFEKGYKEFHELAIQDWKKAIELGSPDYRELEEKIRIVKRDII